MSIHNRVECAMMNNSIFWVFSLLALLIKLKFSSCACDSYTSRCRTSVGQGIYSSGNEANKPAVPIELGERQYYYATIQVDILS